MDWGTPSLRKGVSGSVLRVVEHMGGFRVRLKPAVEQLELPGISADQSYKEALLLKKG